MHARERERGWWTRREEEKTANGQHQRGGGATPKATATPVLALGVWRVWQVWGVCGRRGDQWQPPLWHSGCCGVCVMGLSGGGGSGKACQTNNTPWCVVVDVACVVAGKASGWRGVAATQCPHAHHQPPPWRPPPVPVCVWHKGRGGGDHNTKAARQAPRLCLRCVCDGA